jgi:hypothetical protein
MAGHIAGIHQPNYIPWQGYFYKILKSDVFVILDNVDFQQGNSKSITSRSKIKGINGEILLTVPVKRSENRLINRIQIDNTQHWAKKHLKSIEFSYQRSSFFKVYFPLFEKLLLAPNSNLSELNTKIIQEICISLDIHTPFIIGSELNIEEEGRNERIVKICQKVGADTYLCGKGGRMYMDELIFTQAEIKVQYTDFIPEEYAQLHGPFLPGLSILDALMNLGKEGVLKALDREKYER